MTQHDCESCWYYDYDEEYDEYYCMMDLDEDEVYRFFSTPRPDAPSTARATIIPWPDGSNKKTHGLWPWIFCCSFTGRERWSLRWSLRWSGNR